MQNFKLKKIDEFKFLSTSERNEIISLVAGKNSNEDLFKRVSKRLSIGKHGEKFVSIPDIMENKDISQASKLSILASSLSISQRYELALDLIDLFAETIATDPDGQSKRRLSHLVEFLNKKEALYAEIREISKLSLEKIEEKAKSLEWKVKQELLFTKDYAKSVFIYLVIEASKCANLESFHFMLLGMKDYIDFSMVFLSEREERELVRNFETNCRTRIIARIG